MCVILDEAYCEFNLLDDPDASIELLERHPNLVLLRTFSKVYGLCGLRVGFALCGSEDLPRALDQVRQPFFCNALAQAAAVEALAHQDAVHRPRRRARSPSASPSTSACARWGSSRPTRRPTSAGSSSAPSATSRQVMRGLAERGVLVRGGARARQGAGALRVTYGTAEENARFLDALAEVLSSPGVGAGARASGGKPRRRSRSPFTPGRGARCLLQTSADDHECDQLRHPQPHTACRPGRSAAPGDLARRFGLSPCVSGLRRPHRVPRRDRAPLTRPCTRPLTSDRRWPAPEHPVTYPGVSERMSR